MELSYGVSYIVLWLVSSWPLVQDMGAELPSTTKCLVYLVTMWSAEGAQTSREQVAQLVTGGFQDSPATGRPRDSDLKVAKPCVVEEGSGAARFPAVCRLLLYGLMPPALCLNVLR